jgi:hypothetical protein
VSKRALETFAMLLLGRRAIGDMPDRSIAHAYRRGRPLLVISDGCRRRAGVIYIVSVDRRLLFFILALPLAAGPAGAHDPDTLDKIKSAHGGQVRMAGPFHLELVLERGACGASNPITLYLQTHAFTDVPADGTKATIQLSVGTSPKTTTADLLPSGSNLLAGKGVYASKTALVAKVTLTDKEGQVWSATFTPFARRTPAESQTFAARCGKGVAASK